MKMLLFLFAIILSANTFAQDDEEDFDSINPTYYLDSTYIKYKIKDKVFSRATYTPIIELLQETDYIRLTTDEDLSLMISDSLTRQYGFTQSAKSKNIRKSLLGYVDRIAVDSNTNILFVMVLSPCQPCMNSIIDEINTTTELVASMKQKHIKYIRVNYVQTMGVDFNDFIFIDIKVRFKRIERFNIYSKR